MHISLGDFCEIVKNLKKSNAEKALAVLWFHDNQKADICITSGGLTKLLDDHHVGTPNTTQLGEAIRKSKLANETRNGFSLKPGSRRVIHAWLPSGIDGMQPAMDHSEGYLPDAVWSATRRYIEAVCKQLNGCFRSAYYDAASVMLRRLLETLIIEAYEHLKRQNEIQDGGANYLMLRDLVERACGEKGHAGLSLGRDSKTTLKEVRDVGNWSAHARRYNAYAADLTKIQAGVRMTVQDLIHVADLKKSAA